MSLAVYNNEINNDITNVLNLLNDQNENRNHNNLSLDDTDIEMVDNDDNNNHNNDHYYHNNNYDESIYSEDIPDVLNKLYNYMKISEMDQYGISIFEKIFLKYLTILDESNIYTLVTSYWCNALHFDCIIKYRGCKLSNNTHLKLEITDDLLDTSMQSGASVDKIQSMLLQRRIDNNYNIKLLLKLEKNFFIRNCRLRFWNHEVLVRAFIQNGWLTKDLAQIGLNKFAVHVYDRTLNITTHHHQCTNGNINHNQVLITGFSENFLHSFFITHYSLDSIPKMYDEHMKKIKNNKYRKKKLPIDLKPKIINQDNNHNNNNDVDMTNKQKQCVLMTIDPKHNHTEYFDAHHEQKPIDRTDNICFEEGLEKHFSARTLRRWCELIELLTSRGAKINQNRFKLLPLRYAQNLGQNTYWIRSSSIHKKNQLLLNSINITLPKDLWNIITFYL